MSKRYYDDIGIWRLTVFGYPSSAKDLFRNRTVVPAQMLQWKRQFWSVIGCRAWATNVSICMLIEHSIHVMAWYGTNWLCITSQITKLILFTKHIPYNNKIRLQTSPILQQHFMFRICNTGLETCYIYLNATHPCLYRGAYHSPHILRQIVCFVIKYYYNCAQYTIGLSL